MNLELSHRCVSFPGDHPSKMPFERFWLVEKRSVVTEDMIV
jgi:hypothetical protein